MHLPPTHAQLAIVIDVMRNLSMQTDPQQAAELYAEGLRKLDLVPSDLYLSISRRDLSPPYYRITRSSAWTTHPNPWTEREKLPLLKGGLLADILYSNQPAIITDLPSLRLAPDDPIEPHVRGMNLLIALPHYDKGEAINAGIVLAKDPSDFPLESVPMMIWQANLWGRATLNLVTQQKLQKALNAIDRELRVVADIQRSLLPHTLPQIPGVDIAVHYQTSQRAGGDYYDFFPLPNEQWGIFLADVSGHGTPAAVLMAITHAIAHSHPNHPMPAEELLTFVNQKLATLYTVNDGNFVTAFYGIYDARTHRLTYSSAGHPPPRLLRNRTIIDVDGESSLPLGILPREPFFPHTTQLKPGDRLVLYTDGITETFSPEGELFNESRLDAVCLSIGDVSSTDLLNHLLAELETFSHAAPLTDDRTLLIIGLR